jgi:hypothetical protein
MAVRVTGGIVRPDVRLHLDDSAGGLLAPATDIADEDLA